jgi:peptidyl-prolyl cis-trans isomerase B (cyclophilin B)
MLPIALIGAALSFGTSSSAAEEKSMANPVVVMETSEGTIKIELWPDKAPKTVQNFLSYVDEKFYDGTIFHRVIEDFMIQGGGFTADMTPKNTHAPIKNEARADLKNLRGTIAMARTSVVDSATAQFFINVVDNDGSVKYNLDHTGETREAFGYAVFGKVIDGMDVVDKIKKVPTGQRNVPLKVILIKSVRRAEPAKEPPPAS